MMQVDKKATKVEIKSRKIIIKKLTTAIKAFWGEDKEYPINFSAENLIDNERTIEDECN